MLHSGMSNMCRPGHDAPVFESTTEEAVFMNNMEMQPEEKGAAKAPDVVGVNLYSKREKCATIMD